MDLPDALPDTLLQHFAEDHKVLGAVTPPIFQTSLFVFDEYEHFMETMLENPAGPPYHYSRLSNPNTDIVEQKLAMLEGTDTAKVFGGGMAAISAAIMSCIQAGSHAVCLDTSYGPVKQLLNDYLPKFGVRTTYVDGLDLDGLLDAIEPDTAFVYLESPSSFVFRLQDIERITKVCREKGVTTIFDNSYSTPLYQQPASMGIDIIVHSATKYLGGHSDIVAGVLCTDSKRMERLVRAEVNLFGGILAPFPSWLLLRGMRTLKVRLKAHQEAGNAMAAWLEERKDIESVMHVGSRTFPQQELYRKQMKGSTGLLSFVPKRQEKDFIVRFRNALKLFQCGVSWGGFESLCVPLFLQPMGWTEPHYVVRLYCGLEDVEDMKRDIDQALRVASEG